MVTVWEWGLVRIAVVSSHWFMGEIVREDPFSRRPFRLSVEGISRSVHGSIGDCSRTIRSVPELRDAAGTGSKYPVLLPRAGWVEGFGKGYEHSANRVAWHDRPVEAAKTSARRDDAVDRLHQQLQDSLQELVTSEDWQLALAVAARFHDYSFANSRLIWMQALARGFTPSRVAGYRRWQELERHVRKGERGLQILAPVIRKVELEDGEEERRVVGYRVVHVFDIAQTDGEPLPEVTAQLVQGDLPSHWGKVSELITDAGFDLQVADLGRLGEANGVTDWTRRDVVVRASLPGAQRFKTAIHELAHIRLHEPNSDGRPSCRGVVEVEAESVAYMVCAGLGIDSAGYSLPYVASWSGGDLTKVAATANRVIGCARKVLAELEQDRRLQQAHSVRSPRAEPTSRQTAKAAAPQSTRIQDLDEVLEATTEFYRDQLRVPSGTAALNHLRNRGISDEAVELWQLGYAADSWRALTNALRNQGFSDNLMLQAGVVARSANGPLFDRMRNRLIFPVHDQDGRPRGLAGRLLNGDGPKYLNTPETDLYQKRSHLYGLHIAKEPIHEANHAVVVEGYLDVIACHQKGFTNTVAAAGTTLTPEQFVSLSDITTRATLAFDGDQGGQLAISRIAEQNTEHSVRIRVAHLPAGRDPADLLSENHDTFGNALARARPLSHHLITKTLSKHNLDEPEGMARAMHQSAELIAAIRDGAEREGAVKLIATFVGRPERTIRLYTNQPPLTQPRREQIHNRGLGIP